jgi:hypothetical protein
LAREIEMNGAQLAPEARNTMKAAQFSRFGGPEVLEIVDLPDPHPGPGQIRIVVHAAGISATDPKLRAGIVNFGKSAHSFKPGAFGFPSNAPTHSARSRKRTASVNWATFAAGSCS